jgi:GNAT superfamily N-acetyltransferase
MPIRPATLQDIPALVEASSQMLALTRLKTLPFNPQKTTNELAGLINYPNGKYLLIVAQDGQSVVVGGLVGVIEQPLFSDALVANVVYVAVLPSARMGGYGVRLLKVFEGWAKARSAAQVCFGINSGVSLGSLSGLARKLGYQCVGENFVKDMKTKRNDGIETDAI